EPSVTPFRFTAFAAAPVALTVLPEPVTSTVPPPVALNGVPVVVAMASPPPVKEMLAPVLLESTTPAAVPELMFLAAPLKAITLAPELFPVTEMPRAAPLGLMPPEKVTVPPDLPFTFTANEVVLLTSPGKVKE